MLPTGRPRQPSTRQRSSARSITMPAPRLLSTVHPARRIIQSRTIRCSSEAHASEGDAKSACDAAACRRPKRDGRLRVPLGEPDGPWERTMHPRSRWTLACSLAGLLCSFPVILRRKYGVRARGAFPFGASRRAFLLGAILTCSAKSGPAPKAARRACQPRFGAVGAGKSRRSAAGAAALEGPSKARVSTPTRPLERKGVAARAPETRRFPPFRSAHVAPSLSAGVRGRRLPIHDGIPTRTGKRCFLALLSLFLFSLFLLSSSSFSSSSSSGVLCPSLAAHPSSRAHPCNKSPNDAKARLGRLSVTSLSRRPPNSTSLLFFAIFVSSFLYRRH